MKCYTLTFVILFMASALTAQEVYKNHNDKTGFKISYPTAWSIDTAPKDATVSFANPTKSAQVFVRVMSFKQVIDPAAFLAEIEKSMGVQNIMDPSEGAIDQETAGNVGAEKGAMGVFMLTYDSVPIRQIFYVFSRKTSLYVVVFTFAEAEKEQFRQIMKDMLNSFKVTT
jgi:hypothetical protein